MAKKMGELRRAAQVLGVASSTLRQQGWATASLARIQAVVDDPPDWLIVAREQRTAQDERERADAKRRAACEAEERELAEAYLRAIKDGGDTDVWAAGVLHGVGIPRIDLGDGTVVPILPLPLRVVR